MAETLQDFLISIGYKVDESSQVKVQKDLKQNTFLAIELGKAFINTAQQVQAAAQAMARAMDEMYFASQRTKSSVESIKAIGYAASQLGSSSSSALSALEGIAKLIATNPGGESFLKSLGVSTRDANNQLKSTTEIMDGLAVALRKMPLPTANYVAGFLGIDYKTLLAMREGLTGFEQEYKRMYASAHINSGQAATDANFLMTQLRSLGAAFNVLEDKVVSQVSRRIGDAIRTMREYLVNHFDAISHVIEVVTRVFSFFVNAVTTLVMRALEVFSRLYDGFFKLDKNTQSLIEALFGLIAAWKLVNLAFALSPVGVVVALASAILLLYDDYMTWKKGGESLINWGKWEAEIKAAIDGIAALDKPLGELYNSIKNNLIPALASLGESVGLLFKSVNGKPIFGSMTDDIKNLLVSVKDLVESLTKVVNLVSAITKGNWAEALRLGKDLAWGLVPPAANSTQDPGLVEAPGTSPFGRFMRRNLPSFLGGGDERRPFFGGPSAAASTTGDITRTVHQLESAGRMRVGEVGDIVNGAPTAFGPMQVHQGALTDVNRAMNTNYTTADLANDPNLGMRVGQAYLQMMQQRYPGRPDYAMGAYNQGPGAMDAAIRSGQGTAGLPGGGPGYVRRGMAALGSLNGIAPAAIPAGQHSPMVTDAITQRLNQIRQLSPNVPMPGSPQSSLITAPANDAGSAASLNQTTNITVNGASDPVTTGDFIRRTQELTNSRAIRNLSGAIR